MRKRVLRIGLGSLLTMIHPGAEPVFHDGFEPPCSAVDTGGDRLTDCEEGLLGTNPASSTPH